MLILQINVVYKIRSTGRTCAEIEEALANAGHRGITAYGTGSRYDGAYRINTSIEYYFHNIMSRITGLEGYFSFFATKRLIRYINQIKPDIIHLRNIHGHTVNLPLLFNYLKKEKIPVVFTLHDCWGYTGGCCYYTTIGCNKWKTECGNCPQKRDYPESYFFDWSNKMKQNKEKWFAGINNLTIVGVSQWVANEARQSFLNKYGNITYIYNWINRELFHPYPESDIAIRNKYGIPQNKFVIIGVSSQWKAGTPRFEDYMEISKHLDNDCVIVMIGAADKPIIDDKIMQIPFVKDIQELARLYSTADVYVHCSIEDTFGKVIAEAMACGLPVIVYDITGCAELVAEGCGFLVEPRNIDQVIASIQTIKENGKKIYSEACIKNVENNFDYKTNSTKMINLYQKIIHEQKKDSY